MRDKNQTPAELHDGQLDAATGGSGQATGKRSHKPVTIVKEWDAGTPSSGFMDYTDDACMDR